MRKIAFTDATKKDIIAEQKAKGLFLIEEAIHFDGQYLVFDTVLPPVILSLEERVKLLEIEVAKLKEKP